MERRVVFDNRVTIKKDATPGTYKYVMDVECQYLLKK